MFTTSPSLAQRIERMIGETPVVDPYSHLHGDRPAAADLAALLLDAPGVAAELRTVGQPGADGEAAGSPEERVRRALPHLRRIRNTAAAWCGFRILRDLYDLHEGELTEANLQEVADRVAATGRDPAWPRAVLRERGNIRAVVPGARGRGDATAVLTDQVFYRLDLGVVATGDPVEGLRSLLGEAPAGAALDRFVRDWLDRRLSGPVRFVTLPLPDPGRLPGDGAGAEGDDPVRGFLRSVLGWHHDHGRAIQVVPAANCEGRDLRRVFRHFGGARFDVLAASEAQAREVAALARTLPNVFAAGYGAHDLDPGAVERIAAMRFQVIPMAKFGGFLSDAETVEGTYGRYILVRKSLAAALAGLVERGFYEEDELPPMLKQVLHDTPRDLYGLLPGS